MSGYVGWGVALLLITAAGYAAAVTVGDKQRQRRAANSDWTRAGRDRRRRLRILLVRSTGQHR